MAYPMEIDPMIGVRLNDNHVVCYMCGWESKPHATMAEGEAVMREHQNHECLTIGPWPPVAPA